MGPAPNDSAGQDGLKEHPQFLSSLSIRGKGSVKSSSLLYGLGTLFPLSSAEFLLPWTSLQRSMLAAGIPSPLGLGHLDNLHLVVYQIGKHMGQGGCRLSLLSSESILAPKFGKGGDCYLIANQMCPGWRKDSKYGTDCCYFLRCLGIANQGFPGGLILGCPTLSFWG